MDIIYVSLGICLCSYIRWRFGLVDIMDAFLAMFICYVGYRVVSRIRVIDCVFEKIGEHSMNMFMMHTFINGYYFSDFIYSFKYPIIIVIILLIITLIISICIEKMKKILNYSLLEQKITRKTIDFILKIEESCNA